VSTWILVWLLLLLVPVLFLVFVVGLGLHALSVTRAFGRFAEETSAIGAEIGRLSDRVTSHERPRERSPGRSRPPGGRGRFRAERR
jgi:hypothetical protein